ncbi:MAG TPA: GNAT family N-acetyltransferase [Anaerolineales bacterium]|nr:GNAT family N-acetyltransferase [Anaerolineales bacterium]
MTISIRPLEDADLVQADALLKLAFRSSISRLDDLQFHRQIQPEGWFVASRQEYLLGMVGATRYGAWAHIGLMAVHPDTQRQGIGFALMNFILAELERRQVETVWLDASEMGRPLYEKLGFLSCDETFIFQRSAGKLTGLEPAPRVQILSVRQLDELVQWDTKVFGADRRRVFQVLLDVFPQRSFAQRDKAGRLTGYLFAQKNRIGPWVALQPGSAEELLQIALALPGYEETISVAVPSVNEDAIELMQRCGFEHVRTNRHMWRGVEQYPGQRHKIYAQTSLAVG